MSKYKNKTIIFNNITFKSMLEKRAFELYTEAGFKPVYEPNKYIIWEKHILDNMVNYYKPVKKLMKNNRKVLLPITYTPDFLFTHNGHQIIVDTKGRPNETYPLKLKMFLKYCSLSFKMPVHFFEPHSIREIKQTIELINILPNLKNIK